MKPDECDKAMKELTPAQRKTLDYELQAHADGLRKKQESVRKEAVDADPAVQKERQKVKGLENEYSEAYKAASAQYRKTLEREEGTWNQYLFSRFKSEENTPHGIAGSESAELRQKSEEIRSSLGTARESEGEAEKKTRLNEDQQKRHDDLKSQIEAVNLAQQRVFDGPANEKDKRDWLSLSPQERDRAMASGIYNRDHLDSLGRQFEKEARELKEALPGETAPQKEARLARLKETESAGHRLKHADEAPQLYGTRQKAESLLGELEKKAWGGLTEGERRSYSHADSAFRSKLTPEEQKEYSSLKDTLNFMGYISPQDNRHEWGKWDKEQRSGQEQEALKKEWDDAIARDPSLKADVDKRFKEASDRIMADMKPGERDDFKRRFEMKLSFGKDKEGNLTYSAGYAPTEHTRDLQMRQALAMGMHHHAPAMEIGRWYREAPLSPPGTAAESMDMYRNIGDTDPSKFTRRTGGGGLQATGDEMLIIPAGALRGLAGKGLSMMAARQFAGTAGKEIAINLAWDAGINMASDAVSKTAGDEAAGWVPYAAVAAQLLSGKVASRRGARGGVPEPSGGKLPLTPEVPSVKLPHTPEVPPGKVSPAPEVPPGKTPPAPPEKVPPEMASPPMEPLPPSINPKDALTAAQNREFYKTLEAAGEAIHSLKTKGTLPEKYVTKSAAEAAGYAPGNALENFMPGKQIGGDVFQNTTKIVPEAPGRVWFEADVGLSGRMSRAKQPGTRLLYSSDGLLCITTDHYKTAISAGKWK
jgi:hypothetical protein